MSVDTFDLPLDNEEPRSLTSSGVVHLSMGIA